MLFDLRQGFALRQFCYLYRHSFTYQRAKAYRYLNPIRTSTKCLCLSSSFRGIFHIEKAKKIQFGVPCYVGPINNRVGGAKALSMAVCVIALGLVPFGIKLILYHADSAELAGGIGVVFLASFLILCHLLLHLSARIYVKEIFFNETNKQYTAVLWNSLMRERPLQFSASEIDSTKVPSGLSTVFVKNQPLFITREGFTTEDHYTRFMGFDKPFDYESFFKQADGKQA